MTFTECTKLYVQLSRPYLPITTIFYSLLPSCLLYFDIYINIKVRFLVYYSWSSILWLYLMFLDLKFHSSIPFLLKYTYLSAETSFLNQQVYILHLKITLKCLGLFFFITTLAWWMAILNLFYLFSFLTCKVLFTLIIQVYHF